MSELFPCRVLVDGPLSGPVNMAIDEAMLNAATTGLATLRFYQWDEPTVSVGHFQARSRLDVPSRFSRLTAVRRLSGGGAILHDREVTYSCALPVAHTFTANPGTIYDRVHEAIIEVLQTHGVECRMRGDDAFADQSFLCFTRGDSRDIVIGSNKIVGSAQRRRQGAVLQHGSILLSRSPDTPEFPGVLELANVNLSPEKLIPQLLNAIAAQLRIEPIPASLTSDEFNHLQQDAGRYLLGSESTGK